jgi:hypothetical protein
MWVLKMKKKRFYLMGKRKEYKINLTTAPPKNQTHTKEEVEEIRDKAISLVVDELILNGKLDISKCIRY